MQKKTLKFEKTEIIHPNSNDQLFNLVNFRQKLEISIKQVDEDHIQFDIVGVDTSIANALRRIIIAQVPTMAFHKVFLYQNTSVLPDELLVHRLGLLPIKVDSQGFNFRKQDDELHENNSLKFTLRVKCVRKQEYKDWTEEQIEEKKLKPEEYLDNSTVYSKDLEWIPQGSQKKTIKSVKLVHNNILIAKLRENQQVWIDIYAEKGIGKKHSKWSPVSTAYYKLMPHIQIKDSVFNHEKAQILVQACPAKVFTMKKKKAIVSEPRNCTTCRQCLKLDGVSVQKIKDHFIFFIQSTGILRPQQIFLRALTILEEKSKAYSV